MATIKSKRLSTRRRKRLDQLERNKKKKLRKEIIKQNKSKIRLPKNVLLTDQELVELKKLKEDSKQRAKIILENNLLAAEPREITKLKEVLDISDVFIEVLDYRDLEKSRIHEMENIILSSGKKIFIYLNFIISEIDINYKYILSNEKIVILNDLLQLGNPKMVCIFGQPKTGKFTLEKLIYEKFPETCIKNIKVPSSISNFSMHIRGVVKIEDYNLVQVFKRDVFPQINLEDLYTHYKIPNLGDQDNLLKAIGALEVSSTSPKAIRSGVLKIRGVHRILKDIQRKQIGWYSVGPKVYILFPNK